MQVTRLIVGGLRTTFNRLKSKEYKTIDKDQTTTALSDTCQHVFKEKASTKQLTPLKMYAFYFT